MISPESDTKRVIQTPNHKEKNMSYSTQAKPKGTKLSVQWWQPQGRNGAWRKTLRVNGKQMAKTFKGA
jgi:hypothetical protein